MHDQAKSYLAFRCELDKMAQSAIIRQDPHIKKALSEMGLQVGVNPNWYALKAVIERI